MMPEKLVNSVTQWPILRLTRRVGVLASLAVITLLLVWSIDQSTVTIFIDYWRYPRDSLSHKLDNSTPFSYSQNSTLHNEINDTHVNFVKNSNDVLPKTENPDEVLVNPWKNGTNISSGLKHRIGGVGDSGEFDPKDGVRNPIQVLDWVTVEFEQNYSSNLLIRWLAPGGEPCKDSKTVDIKFVNIDDEKPIVLSTGYVHELVFQALDESGNPHCLGDDYFEIGLSSEIWKSRPPIKDLRNGTYSFTLQVHPDFAGTYNLTIILLFRHFEGLKFSTVRFGYDKELRRIPVTFSEPEARLPELQLCKKSDFNRDVWTGRWTRHARNNGCEISNDGRYRCLESDYPCTKPWCNGSLGMLESNGWVYSAHCSFRLLSSDDAWNCLNNRWLFFWGDSNHVDTIRNILFFFLHVRYQELDAVSRHFDKVFTNPKNDSQSIRITNIFNGHWNMTKNYQGLNSLSDEGYRDLVKSYFNGSSVPDTIIFNSGLHDGIYWRNVRRFIHGAEDAASFWKEMMEEVRSNGLKVSNFIFRSTITTGGYARTLSFNPSKMEVYNGILLDKLKEAGLVTGVIDDFDMTWAWHFDNRCNDGVHYGRFPSKMKWRDGQIGHQYFVDLMLGQVLLNAICAR
ncbi:Polygalacturonase ADPG2 [Bienertia sinuspersici]